MGDVTINGDEILIEKAKCIRKWGTTAGLGELRNGPLGGTVLDETGTVSTHKKALVCLIKAIGF